MGQIDGWMDGWTNGRTDRQTDERREEFRITRTAVSSLYCGCSDGIRIHSVVQAPARRCDHRRHFVLLNLLLFHEQRTCIVAENTTVHSGASLLFVLYQLLLLPHSSMYVLYVRRRPRVVRRQELFVCAEDTRCT